MLSGANSEVSSDLPEGLSEAFRMRIHNRRAGVIVQVQIVPVTEQTGALIEALCHSTCMHCYYSCVATPSLWSSRTCHSLLPHWQQIYSTLTTGPSTPLRLLRNAGRILLVAAAWLAFPPHWVSWNQKLQILGQFSYLIGGWSFFFCFFFSFFFFFCT